jgi:hypothetical protein
MTETKAQKQNKAFVLALAEAIAAGSESDRNFGIVSQEPGTERPAQIPPPSHREGRRVPQRAAREWRSRLDYREALLDRLRAIKTTVSWEPDIVRLGADQCRYPTAVDCGSRGLGHHHFTCRHPALPGKMYCAKHWGECFKCSTPKTLSAS